MKIHTHGCSTPVRSCSWVEAAHLKDTAKTLLTAKRDSVPGWSVQTVNGRTSYSEDEIEEIVLLLPELGRTTKWSVILAR